METFSKSIAFTVINKYGKGVAFQGLTMCGPVYHVAFRRVLWNETFYTLIKRCFSESVISKMHQLWELSLFWECWKFKLGLRRWEKNSEKINYFWDNCIWIGCVKLSLFRREYLSSAVSVLTKIRKILLITNRNFFWVNCLHIDQ